ATHLAALGGGARAVGGGPGAVDGDPGAVGDPSRVMVGEGRPSTALLMEASQVVDGRPSPTMTRGTPAATHEGPSTTPGTSPAPPPPDSIAIIGMAGRYPGAETLAQFWDNLRAGRDSITEVPAQRWDWRTHVDANRKDRS